MAMIIPATRLMAQLSAQPSSVNKFTGRDWVTLLIDKPEFADKCDWRKLNGSDWARLLVVRPMFLDRCDWRKLNDVDWNMLTGYVWVDILKVHPDFADKCNWEILNGANWVDLLIARPEFCVKCDWVKINDYDCNKEGVRFVCQERDYRKVEELWCQLLLAQPQFADKCDWQKLGGVDLMVLLKERPQLSLYCNWSKLDGWDWMSLLVARPEFSDKCDWSRLTGNDWVELLIKQPQFSKDCEWSKLNGMDWAVLLREQPQFGDECDWEKLYAVYPEVDSPYWWMPYEAINDLKYSAVSSSLSDFHNAMYSSYASIIWRPVPDLSVVSMTDTADNGSADAEAEELPSTMPEQKMRDQIFCWASLLEKQPSFADKCDWSRLNGKNWALLLSELPQYADKCDWNKLYESATVRIEFQMNCEYECDGCHDRIDCKNGYYEKAFNCWRVLLQAQPQFAGKCDWSRLSVEDWVCLLPYRPQFADKCDWERISVKDSVDLLLKHNEFSDKIAWSRLGGSDWEKVLIQCPQFSDKCDWAKLNEGNWVSLLKCQPQFADECNWQLLGRRSWISLLKRQPQFKGILANVLGYDDVEPFLKSYYNRELLKIDSAFAFDHVSGDASCLDEAKLDSLFADLREDVSRYNIGFKGFTGFAWAVWLRRVSPEQTRKWCHYSIKDSDWEKINGRNWAGLLKWQPQLASHCTWVKLDGCDWAKLLAVRPEFAEICDWNKTNSWSGTDWAMLICNAPEYVTDARLDKMEGKDLVVVLSKQPQFAGRCDFGRLCGDDWVELLTVQPRFADGCDWLKLNGSNWLSLLKKQPQFAEKRDWKSVSGSELVQALIEFPQIETYCDYEKLYESTGRGEETHVLFMELLSEQASNTILDKCDWHRLSDQDMKWLMRKIITDQRYTYNPKWRELSLFKRQHNQEQKSLEWQDLRGEEILRLTLEYPQFVNKCDMSRLTIGQWADLLSAHPEIGYTCKSLQIAIESFNWNALQGKDILGLLIKCPQFVDKCDLERLTVGQWVTLLERRPEFRDKCLHLKEQVELEMALREAEMEEKKQMRRDRDYDRDWRDEINYMMDKGFVDIYG